MQAAPSATAVEAEPLPAESPDPPSPLQLRFPASRDGDAWLHEPTHTYVVRGTVVHVSVTSLLKKYWPQFRPEAALANYPQWKANRSSKYGSLIRYLQIVEGRDDEHCRDAIATLWQKEGQLASRAGTAMHLDLQRICEGREPPQGETAEVVMFRAWLRDFCARYKLLPWRAEWIIYLEHEGRVVVAGQVDLVLKHQERDEYWCCDWKRKDPAPKYPGGPRQILGEGAGGSKFGEETGFGPFADIPHSDFSVYTTQLNTYGYIAATQYGVDFRDRMLLVQVHPSLSEPVCVRVERLDHEIETMFALEITAMSHAASATEPLERRAAPGASEEGN